MVVQDIFMTETAKFANVVLPAACYARAVTRPTPSAVSRSGEKPRTRPARRKTDWQIFCELAKHMGFEKQFPSRVEEVFTEISKVTPSYGGMNYARLEKPEALHWPCPTAEHTGTPILHKERLTTRTDWVSSRRSSGDHRQKLRTRTTRLLLTTGRCIWQWRTGHHDPSLCESRTRRAPPAGSRSIPRMQKRSISRTKRWSRPSPAGGD